jgi:hypothetical protein
MRMDESRSPKELAIEIRFTGQNGFAAGLVTQWLEDIEREVFALERSDIDVLQAALAPEVPAPYFDALRHRFRILRGRTFNVSSAANGSIVLFGTVSAASYWLLKQTLGEAVKESWKQSPWHARAVSVLSTRVGFKAKRLAETFERIEPTFPIETGSLSSESRSVSVEESDKRITVKVEISVYLPPIPPLSMAAPDDDVEIQLPTL